MKDPRFARLRAAATAVIALSGLLLGGCEENQPPAPSSTSAPANAAPAEARYTITANDDMKYDVERITAKPGQSVVVTLRNIGTAPKFSMGHNFVLLQKGVDSGKFIGAGSEFANTGYIAPTLKSNVLAASQLLGPGESDMVKFRAPTVQGEYEFVCTFPGHAAVGMKGKLVVEP